MLGIKMSCYLGMKYQHPQEILRIIKELSTSPYHNIVYASDKLVNISLRELDHLVGAEQRFINRLVILCGLFNTAYKHIILSYIKASQLEANIIKNLRHHVYSSRRGDMFAQEFRKFMEDSKKNEGDLAIELVVDFFCYDYVKYLAQNSSYYPTFFMDLFSWYDSYEGGRFWLQHEQNLKITIDCLSFKDLLKFQFN